MTCRAEGASETRPCRQTPVVREARRAPSEKKKTARPEASIDATRGRERTRSEPLDRGLSPHVSCQAKARVPICAPKDRFTRVLAASFTGAPRYTREVFILGSRSSRVFLRRRRLKKNKNPKKLRVTSRPAAAPRRLNARVARWKKKSFCGLVCAQAQPTNKQPRVLSSRQRARRGAAKTSASEFCFSGFSGSRKSRKRKTSLTSLRAVSKRRRTETRIVSPLFPTDQYKHVSLCGPTNAASRDRTRAQLPDETARGLFSRGKARTNARRTVYFPAAGRKKRTRERRTRVRRDLLRVSPSRTTEACELCAEIRHGTIWNIAAR